MDKSDEELLAEANALDAAYAGAELFDAQKKIEYLERILKNLVTNIHEDISSAQATEHFWASVYDAEEALGYHTVE